MHGGRGTWKSPFIRCRPLKNKLVLRGYTTHMLLVSAHYLGELKCMGTFFSSDRPPSRHGELFSKRRIFISTTHLPRSPSRRLYEPEAPNTLTTRLRTGGTARHHRSCHRRGCLGPNCKEGRRDSSHSKIMRLFEKSSSCPEGVLRNPSFPRY
jgi:hypothetical protein